MVDTLRRVIELVAEGQVRVSEHGYDELAAEGIPLRDLVTGLPHAESVEDYPAYAKGPCVLVLQRTDDGSPVHVLWGIPRGRNGPAVLVTAYRPDPERWDADFRKRR